MSNIKLYKLAKYQSRQFISDRHLYVANIIKYFFSPLEYKNLCEIGAGKLELATILAKYYERIDAYETQLKLNSNNTISNLQIYGSFSQFTQVTNYNLLLSVVPYYHIDDIYDTSDIQELTEQVIMDILNSSVENKIDLFVIFPNFSETDYLINKIKCNKKYNELIYDNIDLHYEMDDQIKIVNHKVLIYKKNKKAW